MAVALTPSDLLPLVDRLADAQWHSGEQLAQDAGITRSALAKRVQRLAEWGLHIEARQNLGYRLAQPLERLDADAIRRALPASAAARLLGLSVLAATDSTNRQLLEADARRDPQALFAEFQSAGRGRRGRGWISPFGANLYLSLSWSFPAWPADLTALPLAIGVGCVRALQDHGLAGPLLKWPNDLVVDGRKLGGVLIEHRGEAGGSCRAVIGVGLNVAMQPDQAAGVTQPWTTVAQVRAASGQPPVSRNALAASLLGRLVETVVDFGAHGFAAFAPSWSALDATRDRTIVVAEGDGSFHGIARGTDASGALQVETAAGLRRVLAGDVSVRPA